MQPATVVGLQEPHASANLLAESRAERLAANERADQQRYRALRHVASCLDEIGVAGRRVLEVGMGDGAEAEQLIRRGARFSGLDLDRAVVEQVTTRMKDRDLPYDALRHGDVADLPWPSESFDIVFSHGLLDRLDDLTRAQAELRRVLRPGGQLVVMVRARRSWRYRVSLRGARRAAVVAAYPLARLGVPLPVRLGEHVQLARRQGLAAALATDALLAASDGADRSPRRVFTRRDVETTFSSFTVSRAHQHVAPRALGPLSRWFGWHLWVHLTPRP